MPPVAIPAGVEQRLEEMLMQQNHFLLLLGIVGIIYALKYITPIGNWLFSDTWKWVISPLNLAMSFFGIFVLKLTDIEKSNVKAMVAIVIAAFATISWEWIIKYIDQFLRERFKEKVVPPTPPTP